MALPPRLWLPDGTHELPPPSLSLGAPPGATASRPSPSSITPVQRIRRRALWRGEAGLPDKSVLVEWFPAAELERERLAARRVQGLCHVHLLRLLDIGAADARNAYAVCEAPDGVDLFTVLRAAAGELPAWWGVGVAQSVTRALLAIERHQRRGPRRSCGHGRVNLATVFVGWDGSVRLLAFSPISSVGSRPEEAIAPELRLSERLLTPAADVFAVGALLRDLLPPAALRRPALARLLRRCLHTQADQRIALRALDLALCEQLDELQAPLARASATGEVLGQSCPRATVDLLDADWGETTGDGFAALPPTLAPLSASTVALSPTWLWPTQPQRQRRTSIATLASLALPAALGLFAAAAAALLSGPASLPQLPQPAPPPAAVAPPPAPAAPTELLPLRPGAAALPAPELRLTVERIQPAPERLLLLLRFTNVGSRPAAVEPSRLRLLADASDELGLLPLASAPLQIGPGRVQRLQLEFPLPAPKTPASTQFLSLRDSAQMPK